MLMGIIFISQLLSASQFFFFLKAFLDVCQCRKQGEFDPCTLNYSFFRENVGTKTHFSIFRDAKIIIQSISPKKREKLKRTFRQFLHPQRYPRGTRYLSSGAEFGKSVRTIPFFGQENPLCHISSS